MQTKKSIWFILLVTLFLLAGCSAKKEYIVDFRIVSFNYDGIYVIHQKTETSAIDTSFIHRFNELIIHVETGDESVIQNHLIDTELPFHFLDVQNMNGESMNCDVNNLSCWERELNENEEQYGSVTLTIRDNSF